MKRNRNIPVFSSLMLEWWTLLYIWIEKSEWQVKNSSLLRWPDLILSLLVQCHVACKITNLCRVSHFHNSCTCACRKWRRNPMPLWGRWNWRTWDIDLSIKIWEMRISCAIQYSLILKKIQERMERKASV